MNKLKKMLLPLLYIMVGVIMLNACEDNNKPQETIKINLNETSKTLNVGEKFTLTATPTPQSDMVKITWSSSDDEIATVQDGEVTAVNEGTATITAKLENGEKATCKVTVVKKKDDNNNPTPTPSTLKFKKDEYSVTVGETLDLKKEIDSTEEITWSSSNDKIATVNGGEVTAVAEGSATITAELGNGAKGTCKVTVLKKNDDNDDPTPGELKFKKEKYTLGVKETLDLKEELSGATGELLWTSYDENIATVDGEGVVKGVADGTVMISVDTEDGNTAECTIVVGTGVSDDNNDDDDDDDEVSSGTTISFGIPDIDLTEGTTFKLKVIFMPIGANEPITWSSSNEEIATVEDGVVTAIKEGHTKITARISNGAKATIKVIVKKKKEPTVNPLKFKQEKYTIRVGETFNLKQELQGNTHKLLWISYNEDIAYVDDNGIVTAKKVGEAEISVDEDPWGASCKIVVIPADSGADDE